MERGIDVENSSGVVVIGDGNEVVTGPPAVVRSAYWEQVRRIAPDELVGRERELAELAAFSRTGRGYFWWRADAWAGKSALMAWFALAPPPGVRIVPFFITARLGAQNDAAAYVDVVLEQLAELAGEGLPALLTSATCEAHLLRLYRAAAHACAARGERLVLLVDGLDEDRGVTTGPDAHSIASLLPADLPVIVSGRPNPPLPADVPERHPLRDPGIVRTLPPSPKAHAIRVEAERELKRLIEADGLPYALLGLLTAAGGGLTADDLAELTGEIPYRVRDVLRTGPGRTFALRGDAYLLAHEELAAGAREMLGLRELDRCRDELHAWAEKWRGRGWPKSSPSYLLHGYVPMLRESGDVDRMLDCAFDEARHDRLLDETGGIGGALGEIRTAGEAVLEEGEGAEHADLVMTMLRLGFRRSELNGRNGNAPVELAAAWAAAGQVDRAVAMVRGRGMPQELGGLCAIAERLLEQGHRERAEELAAEAEDLVLREVRQRDRDRMAARLVPLLLAIGALDRAEWFVRVVEEANQRGGPLLALIDALCASGASERAFLLARAESDRGLRGRAVDRVSRALLAVGRVDDAERVLREGAGRDEEFGIVLFLDGSRALKEAGHGERGDVLRAEALSAFDGKDIHPWRDEVVRALVAVGEFDRLDQWHTRVFGGRMGGYWAHEIALAGAWDRARAAAADSSAPVRDLVLRTVAEGLLGAGRMDEVEELLEEIAPENAFGLHRDLAAARVRAGDFSRAWELIEGLEEGLRGGVVTAYARALCARGRRDLAMAVVADGGRTGAFAGVGVADALLDAGERSTAVGLLAAAERTLRMLPRERMPRVVSRVAASLARVPGQRDTARALLDETERAGAVDAVVGFVSALAATGQARRAEQLAWSRPTWERVDALQEVLGAFAGAGDHQAVVEIVERAASAGRIDREFLLTTAVGGLVKAGAWDQVERLMVLEKPYERAQHCALVALGKAKADCVEEAAEWLDRAEHAVAETFQASVVPDLVRAQLALGRRADAERHVERARSSVGGPYATVQVGYVARAFVLIGAYEEAVAYVRQAAPPNTAERLLVLAGELTEEEEYERAAALLAELHPLGHGCARAYADLALAHPDPVRARRFAALALHLGDWSSVLDAVLHVEPDALPSVLAEADRLLGGSGGRWSDPVGQADLVRSSARTSSAKGSPLP
ncbi:hypothetical protein [Streptomyces sp. NPDC056361]|uniref:hypothetical protein n=1 Tax=Streptomyces sp. NPDC056361 TaxID=3345795 RepID=UPI0035DA01C2